MFKPEKYRGSNRRIVIRTTEELAERIFKTAQDKDMSVNNLLVSCIEYAFNDMKK